ncbi:MAG: SusC/RagA family TonB-linked outer membrane protein, partial [Bacteroidales bacterium]|nr:SusC/RagA family TonB-linked outer membrane protein [Bacteroidales bacterium]
MMISNLRIKTNGRYALAAWLLALLLCVQGLATSDCLAQSQAATGNVVSSSDGQPLPGVNVLVKGTTNGTITDFDGNFSLSTENGATLVFSFLGFTNQEVVFTGQPLKIALVEEASDLDEVVVVGYGVQKKKLVTGATVQVKGDDVQKLNTNNALQALQGQTPGVNIQSTSGQPGSAMNVSIRGLGTVGNSQPLYLIDGVGGDITTLNPADIESIDVLKDAASAAIYGAQAANGVVLVTTKSGKEGKGVVSYDGYYGLQRVYRKNETLNAREYMTIMDEAALNSGSSAYNWASFSDVINADGTPKYDTNWLDEIINDDAVTQSHNLSITGGSKTSNYAISLGYMGQEGVIGGSQVSNYDRYNFRINSEAKLYDGFLTVGEHVGVVYKEQRGMGTGNIYNNNIRGAYVTSPLSPVYEEGSDNYYSPANQTWNNGDGNPLANMMLNRHNRTKNMSIDANVYAQIEPIKNLKIKTVYAIRYGGSEYRSFTPIYTSKDGVHGFASTDQSTYSDTKVNQSNGSGISQVWQNTASYDFTIADEHQFNVLIGTEMSKYDGGSTGGYNTTLIAGFDDWSHAYLDNTEGTESKKVNGSPYDSTRGASYFARLGWNWNEKYMVNATFRSDASSKFEKDNRYGFFPSVSAGWTFSEEGFMDATRDILDFAKLRASWGQVGNANINC